MLEVESAQDSDVDYIGPPRSELGVILPRDNEALSSQKQNRATLRVAYAGYGERVGARFGGITEVLYPNVYYIQDQPFPLAYYEQLGVEPGELDFEYGRMGAMLTIPELKRRRGLAASMSTAIGQLTSVDEADSMLDEWRVSRESLQNIAVGEFQTMKEEMMHCGRPSNGHGVASLETSAAYYEVNSTQDSLELGLFNRALAEVQFELQHRSNGSLNIGKVQSFLEIYSFLKDPISPMEVSSNQVYDFLSIYNEAEALCQGLGGDPSADHKMLTQAALESSYNAIPTTQDELIIRHSGAVEMRYDYVDVLELPRAEFARHPVAILQELVVDFHEAGDLVMTPIVIAPYTVPGTDEVGRFIVDGNNRATAILMGKFLETVGDISQHDEEGLQILAHNFVTFNDLDIEWEVDLFLGINQLLEMDANERGDLLNQSEFFAKLKNADIPAMVTLESSFFTLDMVHSRGRDIELLQPALQAAANQKSQGIALGSKMQSHGRESENNIKMVARQREPYAYELV